MRVPISASAASFTKSTDRAGCDQGGHAVGCRRPVAQIAAHAGAAADLDRADQLDAVEDAGPGLAQCGMAHDLHPGGGRADAKSTLLGYNLPHLGNLLDV